jgi:thioesterase domain-containing protein
MFDAAAPPGAGTEEGQPDEITLLVGVSRLNNVTLSEELLRRLDARGRVSYVLEQFGRAGGAAAVSLDESQLQSMLEGARINLRARARYVPRPYPKRVTLFRCEEALPHDRGDSRFQAFQDAMLGWGGLSQEPVAVHAVPGNHFTLFAEPNVQALADRLKACLRESRACDLGKLQVSS